MSRQQVAKALLKYGRSLGTWTRPIKGRRRFTQRRANAFLVGVLLDRQIDAGRAWEAADWIVDSIGEEENSFWQAVRALESRKLKGFMRYGWGGQAFHRHWKTMGTNLQDCAKLVVEKYNGDPRRIWNGEHHVTIVRERLEELPGIGKALSRMAVLILVRNNGLIGGKKSLAQLDVKPDDLLQRVFKRAGLVPSNPTFEDFLVAARELNPRFPAELDPPSWSIGRLFCKPIDPKCGDCPLNDYCPRLGL